jgi:hypothetical protein
LFPTQRVFTGAIKIECLLRDPNMPGPGPRPENRDIEDLPIPTPMPDDPGRNDLIQDHLFNVGSGLTPTAEVPEPGFTGLLALAGLLLAGRKWMNRTPSANRSN